MVLAISVMLMTVTGGILFLFPQAMMSIFTSDRAVIEAGGRILRIVACSEPLYGAMIIFEGIYHGVGQSEISIRRRAGNDVDCAHRRNADLPARVWIGIDCGLGLYGRGQCLARCSAWNSLFIPVAGSVRSV